MSDGTLEPVFEIMRVNSAIRNMIRESKIHQIDSVIYSSMGEGMVAMDASLLRLYEAGRISRKEALFYSANADYMEKKLSGK